MGVLLVYSSGQISYWMCIVEKMELVISSSSQVLNGCNQKENKEERREMLW